MKLLVDIGNTRLKWATSVDGVVSAGGVFAHRERPFAAALAAEWSGLVDVDAVLVASVVDAAIEDALARFVEARFGRRALFPRSPAAALGVRNAYAEPARLGIDRFLALAALHARAQRLQVLVTVGTAMTIDALAADGIHLGGLIVASPELMREGLLARTALVRAEGRWDVLPSNTADAIHSGALYAAAGAVNRFGGEVGARLGRAPVVVVAGGGGDELAALLANAERAQNLVISGLALWAAATTSMHG